MVRTGACELTARLTGWKDTALGCRGRGRSEMERYDCQARVGKDGLGCWERGREGWVGDMTQARLGKDVIGCWGREGKEGREI